MVAKVDTELLWAIQIFNDFLIKLRFLGLQIFWPTYLQPPFIILGDPVLLLKGLILLSLQSVSHGSTLKDYHAF